MGKKKPVEEESEEEAFSVEKLVDMKEDKKKGTMFLVKWKGYPASQNTWEPVSNLEDECQDMMDALAAKLSGKGKKAPEKKAAPAKKAAAKKATSPRPKTANTRFMTTKPKRDKPAPADAPPAKKQKVEKAAPAKKAAGKKGKAPAVDLKAISDALMASVLGRAMPKEEKKPAKAAKAAKASGAGQKRKKGDDAVMEVDKIIGMRARKGGVQYKILWQDKSQTWEPYDNVMDDDLVDEFEEAKQIEVYGGASLAAGAEVEVKNIIDGFENSWSGAVVQKKEKGGKFTVEYTGFVDDDGEPMVEGGLERKRLRVAPPSADKGWEPVVGEIVEVNEDDCWWEAFVESAPAKSKVSLKFRVSDEVKSVALGKKVRPCSWLTLEK